MKPLSHNTSYGKEFTALWSWRTWQCYRGSRLLVRGGPTVVMALGQWQPCRLKKLHCQMEGQKTIFNLIHTQNERNSDSRLVLALHQESLLFLTISCWDNDSLKMCKVVSYLKYTYTADKNEGCTDEARMKTVPMRQEWRLDRWGENEGCTNEERTKTVPIRVATKELAFYNVVAVLWLGEAISRHYRI